MTASAQIEILISLTTTSKSTGNIISYRYRQQASKHLTVCAIDTTYDQAATSRARQTSRNVHELVKVSTSTSNYSSKSF